MSNEQRNVFDRRDLLRLLSVSALASTAAARDGSPCAVHQHAGAVQTAELYTPKFFTPEEVTFVEDLMERIVPADEHSPGAKAAKVVLFADHMLATGGEQERTDWKAGIAAVRAELSGRSADAWLADASQHEKSPQTPGDIFFVALKQMTVGGYYTSEIGIHQDLNYQGNTYLQEFEGCTHPEHITSI